MGRSSVELFLGSVSCDGTLGDITMFFGEPFNVGDAAGPGATVFAAGMAGWISPSLSKYWRDDS